MARARKSYMSAEEFKALREATGSTIGAWAILLDCGKQSIYNMENGSTAIGRQMSLLAVVMAHPAVRALLPEIFRYRDEIVKKTENSSVHL